MKANFFITLLIRLTTINNTTNLFFHLALTFVGNSHFKINVTTVIIYLRSLSIFNN